MEYRKLSSMYDNMTADRQPYLDKAKEAIKYTIPSLLKDEETGNTIQTLIAPNQSLGAIGVNNLAAKLVLVLLPPNQTFYKFNMDELALKQMSEETNSSTDNFKSEVNKGLAIVEKLLLDYMEDKGDRVIAGEGQKHLIVVGNVMLVHDAKTGLKLYPLSRFVIKRDYVGNVLKAITKETIGFYTLPEEVQKLAQASLESEGKDITNLKEVDLYTGYFREKNTWLTYQEVCGVKIESSVGKYPIEICPFMALRYTRIDGESYGRSLIEDLIGDLSYYDTISKAINQSSFAASKLVMLVNPQGTAKISQLSKAKNGDFVAGREGDVSPLQVQKYYDLQAARATAENLENRLGRIFLLTESVQRNAERVTAEEIRTMVRALEESHGNYYSILSKEFQLAYVKIAFFHLKKTKNKTLPDLIRDKNVSLRVTTGLEALGRGSDLNKITTWLTTVGQFSQFAQAAGVKMDVLAEMVATSLNLDITGLVYTAEEKASMQNAAMNQSLLEKTAPNMVNQFGGALQKRYEQENNKQE